MTLVRYGAALVVNSVRRLLPTIEQTTTTTTDVILFHRHGNLLNPNLERILQEGQHYNDSPRNRWVAIALICAFLVLSFIVSVVLISFMLFGSSFVKEMIQNYLCFCICPQRQRQRQLQQRQDENQEAHGTSATPGTAVMYSNGPELSMDDTDDIRNAEYVAWFQFHQVQAVLQREDLAWDATRDKTFVFAEVSRKDNQIEHEKISSSLEEPDTLCIATSATSNPDGETRQQEEQQQQQDEGLSIETDDYAILRLDTQEKLSPSSSSSSSSPSPSSSSSSPSSHSFIPSSSSSSSSSPSPSSSSSSSISSSPLPPPLSSLLFQDKSSILSRIGNGCAICLESYEVSQTIVWSTSSECPHVFHQDCIIRYLVRINHPPLQQLSSPSFQVSRRRIANGTSPCPCCRRPFCTMEQV